MDDAQFTEDFKSVYRRGEVMGARNAKQNAREEMIYWISKHLPTTLAGETKLSSKEAHNFASAFMDVVKLRFDGKHDE